MIHAKMNNLRLKLFIIFTWNLNKIYITYSESPIFFDHDEMNII